MQDKKAYRPALRLSPCGPAVNRNRRGASYRIQCATPRGVVPEGAASSGSQPRRRPQAPGLAFNNWRTQYAAAAGYRNRTSGALGNVGSNGNWWTFAPNSQTNARYLNFNSGNVNPLNTNNRANGYGVWPCRVFGRRREVCFYN